MKEYRVYQADVFTKEILTGNAAGVVTNADGLTDEQMQKIARELNDSETAFILPGKPGEYDIEIRYFTPTSEVPMCGHATIGAHYVRARELGLADGTCVLTKTGAGILPVDIKKTGDDYRIVMTGGKPEVTEIDCPEYRERLAHALRIRQEDFREDFPVAVASMGHAKVMVPIREEALLHRMKPDMKELYDLSAEYREYGSSDGFYVFTYNPQEHIQFHGRMFAPYIGITEDPVTGNANGPVGVYMVHYGLVDTLKEAFEYCGIQGEAMGRPGVVHGRVAIEHGKPVKVQIAGEAVPVFATTITL